MILPPQQLLKKLKLGFYFRNNASSQSLHALDTV